jgi:glycosyltransferase involved in cell wall biosynthesis
MPPPVTVVIPCFEDGATVGEAVASARAQEPAPEVVVVDDGSTDPATLERLRALEADGVRVLRTPNRGVAAARMAAVAATSAPYVLPLDADDRLLPGALRVLLDVLERHPEASAAWGRYRNFGDHSSVQRTARELDPWAISYFNDLPVVALLRRSALDDAGGWSLEAGKGYSDWDLWMALAERGHRGIGLPVDVYEYRRHGGGRLMAKHVRVHGTHHAALLARHPALVAGRAANRRRSSAPRALKAGVAVLDRLPLGDDRRRVALGALNHLARGRGLVPLVRRLRTK